ncbi:MAG TPA: hypothetical protein ENN29_10695 [Candidatus Hydrogenedentes bacterium]|nr:hypothetical protein [Candidatus Hydrogenedentota bacterium]
MYGKLTLGSMALGLCGALSAAAATFHIAEDRMAVVDGERVFILGLYENPSDDAVLREAAESGFNLVYVSANEAALDRVHAQNLWAWINAGYAIDLSEKTEEREAALHSMVERFAAHPAMLVWEVPDEALWNCWYNAILWRTGEEPRRLTEKINALEDEDQKRELRGQLAEVRRLQRLALYDEAEPLADALWSALGEYSPRPGYGLADAPARAAKLCEGMIAGYKLLRKIDPDHPVWMNHAPRNQIAQLAMFNQGADIVGCDIYPIPFTPKVGHSDLAERSLAAVGAYTRRMQQAAPGKPVWMVLQGFGWGDIQPERSEAERRELRRPTYEESRFMAYDAIARGARGILYWGTASIEKDSTLWQDLMRLAAELRALQPVLSAHDAPIGIHVEVKETFGSVDRTIHVLPKQVGDKVWLIIVNECPDPLVYVLRGLGAPDGTIYEEIDSGRRVTVDDGAISMGLAAQSVHILRPE